MPEAVKNLLRPNQVREGQEELRRIDSMLNAPPHIRKQISDVPLMAARRHRLAKELEEYTPKPYAEHEKDAAIKRFRQLAEEIKIGMPSDAVMRRNPPGAVQQHQAWDRRNKNKVLERKHIGLRLGASGDLDDTLGEAAINVEMLRKRDSGYDLPMDNAQIPQKTDYHIPPQPESVVLSDQEIKTLEVMEPDLANMLVTMDANTRRQVKDILKKFVSESAAPEAPKPAKPLSRGMQRIVNLRGLCKAHGINSFRMNAEKMAEALKAKGVAVEE